MFIISLIVEVGKLVGDVRIRRDRFLVNDTLTFEDIALVTEKSIDTGLQGLLHDELLNYKVGFTPVFQQICDQLMLTEIYTGISRSHPLPEDLQDVLWRHDTNWSRVTSPSNLLFESWYLF